MSSRRTVSASGIRHQLVILENGFDVACGLDSKFPTLFEPRMQRVEEALSHDGEEHIALMADYGLTDWDIILRARKKALEERGLKNWCDVESVISEVTQRDYEPGDDYEAEGIDRVGISSLIRYFHYVEEPEAFYSPLDHLSAKEDESNKAEDDDPLEDDDSDEMDYGFLLSPPDKLCIEVGPYLGSVYKYDSSWKAEDVCDALYQELSKLEEAFAVYLGDKVRDSKTYGSRATTLLDILMSDDYESLKGGKTTFTILDFNYTRPELPSSYERYDYEFVNIHGQIDEAVIFGSDGTSCMGDRDAVRFTKTYRVAQSGRAGITRRVAYPPSGKLLPKPETIAIKFYGHSLARADYSYFQSIFDMVDLYGGNTRLYFYYMNHRPAAKEDYLVRIASLLYAYGNTLDNRDHGKNLMHKLILENRLVLREVPVEFWH